VETTSIHQSSISIKRKPANSCIIGQKRSLDVLIYIIKVYNPN